MIDDFLKIRVRENAGSISASRFDYQKDWSICQLLEVHNKQSDYLFVFDYHDDLVIMDSESNPSKISFYQIKGKKTGKWRLSDLLSSSQTKDKKNYLLSIVGKLYSHKLNFADKVESVNFISNARFSATLSSKTASESKDSICIVELAENDKRKLHNKLKQEHNLKDDDFDFESISFLKVAELSLNDSSTHTVGKLANFLNDRDAHKKYNVPVIYKVLFDEVKRRTAYSKQIDNLENLLENKAISKKKFDEILDRVGIDKNYEEIWNGVQAALIHEQVPYSNIIMLKKQWDKLQIERMKYNNEVLFNMLDEIKRTLAVKMKETTFKGMTLVEMIEDVYKSSIFDANVQSYPIEFIEAAIISAIHE